MVAFRSLEKKSLPFLNALALCLCHGGAFLRMNRTFESAGLEFVFVDELRLPLIFLRFRLSWTTGFG